MSAHMGRTPRPPKGFRIPKKGARNIPGTTKQRGSWERKAAGKGIGK